MPKSTYHFSKLVKAMPEKEKNKDNSETLEDLKIPQMPKNDEIIEIEEQKPIEEIEPQPKAKQSSSGWTLKQYKVLSKYVLARILQKNFWHLKRMMQKHREIILNLCLITIEE